MSCIVSGIVDGMVVLKMIDHRKKERNAPAENIAHQKERKKNCKK